MPQAARALGLLLFVFSYTVVAQQCACIAVLQVLGNACTLAALPSPCEVFEALSTLLRRVVGV